MDVGNPELAFEIAELRNASLQAQTRPAAAPKEFSIETLVDTWTRLASHKKA